MARVPKMATNEPFSKVINIDYQNANACQKLRLISNRYTYISLGLEENLETKCKNCYCNTLKMFTYANCKCVHN